MGKYEDDDIDKIFEQIIGSDKKSETNNQDQLAIKDLVLISQSFARAIEHVNDMILEFMTDKDYFIEEIVEEMLGAMYKISEDLDKTMIDFVLEDSIDIIFDYEDETDDEGNG